MPFELTVDREIRIAVIILMEHGHEFHMSLFFQVVFKMGRYSMSLTFQVIH